MSHSNAILQYIADKYAKDDKIYPKEPKARAIINHRLCFNLAFYYRAIDEHVVSSLAAIPRQTLIIEIFQMAPIFFDYKRTPLTLKKTQIALDVFNTYLQQLGGKYAAGGNLLDLITFQTTLVFCRQLDNCRFPFGVSNDVSWSNRFWHITIPSSCKMVREFQKGTPWFVEHHRGRNERNCWVREESSGSQPHGPSNSSSPQD